MSASDAATKRTLYTLAYPRLADADRRRVDEIRSEHDLRYRDAVAPHFTLVFACDAVAQAEYLRHVEAVAAASPAIDFCCRYAMLGADDGDDTGYAFLVPDEGYSGLSLLHDRLYTGPLSSHLRLDLPYVPHMTVGTLPRRQAAKRLCDRLNRAGLCLPGSVHALTVGAFAGGRIDNLASFPLKA